MQLSIFLTMWRHPRLVGWCLAIAAGTTLARLLCKPLSLIPGVVGFDVGFVLALSGGMIAGPAGVIGSFAGSWAGDWLVNETYAMTLTRALALAGAAWAAGAGWAGDWQRGGSIWGFMVSGIAGCLISGVWLGLGGEWSRLYPYAYVVSISLFFSVFGWLLIAPWAFVAGRSWDGAFGAWQGILRIRGGAGGRYAIARWVGAVGAAGVGILVNGWETGRGLLDAPPIGASGGVWTWIAAGLFLVVHSLGLLGTEGTDDRSTLTRESKSTRFSRLYLPPLERL